MTSVGATGPRRPRLGATLCGLAVLLGPVGTRADEPTRALLDRPNPLRELVPSPLDAVAARTLRLERKLAAALRRLPKVTHAEVALHLAPPEPLSWDPQPSAREARVVAYCTSEDGVASEIRDLTRTLLPGLEPAVITVATVPVAQPEPAATLRKVGPFRVAEESVGALRLVLASSLGANVLLAAAWLAHGAARRRAQATARPSSPPPH